MVDKTAPQYPAYIAECHLLGDELSAQWGRIIERRQRAGDRGMDNQETSDLHHEFSIRLKEIQKKYGFD